MNQGKSSQKNWDLLKRSSAIKTVAETRIIYRFRKPKNLKDLLVRAKLPAKNDNKKSNVVKHPSSQYMNKCTKVKCDFCPLIQHSGRITSQKLAGNIHASIMSPVKVAISFIALHAEFAKCSMWAKQVTAFKNTSLATKVQLIVKTRVRTSGGTLIFQVIIVSMTWRLQC